MILDRAVEPFHSLFTPDTLILLARIILETSTTMTDLLESAV